ncbi:MAG: hypothetical protein JWO92_2005 [Chitinophagaceae bacterium]|nr:hypothetical protein [Chitinophagaceae bacterium]
MFQKINTIKHLCYILKIKEVQLSEVINNIDKYYYEKEEIKYDKHMGETIDISKLKRIHPD